MKIVPTDLRRVARSLYRESRLVLAVLLTFALGIGVTTSVLSVVHAILFRPLPYPQPHRIVRVFEEYRGTPVPLTRAVISNATYCAWLDRGPRALDALAVYSQSEEVVRFAEGPERVRVATVTSQLLPILGGRPAVGRLLSHSESSTVVLSDATWRTRFRADVRVIGAPLEIGGRTHTVVGVLQPGFTFPDSETGLWVALDVPRPLRNGQHPDVRVYSGLGRLRAGHSVADAASEGTVVARDAAPSSLAARVLFGPAGAPRVGVRTLAEEMTGAVRPALIALTGSVLLILLAACATVANLLLSRSLGRRRELAIRASLGATRSQIGRLLLGEAAALASIGGLLGLGLAWTLVRLVPAVVPADFPRLHEVKMDATALVIATAVSCASALIAGFAPSVWGGQPAPWEALKSGRGAPAASGRLATGARLRDVLVATQAAVAVVLVVLASLLARSFVNLLRVDAGYTAAGVLIAGLDVPSEAVPQYRYHQAVQLVLERLRATPGVVAAGAGTGIPLGGGFILAGFPVVTIPIRPHSPAMTAAARTFVVSAGYAEALGLRLRRGRAFSSSNHGNAVQELIVNEEFARLYLKEDPVGVRIRWGDPPMPSVAEVVGVVGNILEDGNDRLPQPAVFQRMSPWHDLWSPLQLVVRTAGTPAAFAPQLRAIVRELAPEVAVETSLLSQRVSASVSHPRFRTIVLVMFAALALALTVVGVYGVQSVSVARRSPEWALRAAMGATPKDLAGVVLREGLAVALAGVGLGLVATAGLVRLAEGLLFGISRFDVLTFLGAPTLVILIAVAGCLLPAARAAAADPAAVLRQE